MTPLRRMILPLLALLALAGCAEDGSLLPEISDEIDPTLPSIQENIFTPFCSGCHFLGGTGPMPLDTEENSYNSLVVFPFSFNCPGSPPRVSPGDPDSSCLVFKIEWADNYSGEGMPPTGQLSQDRIDAIRQWILDGANP